MGASTMLSRVNTLINVGYGEELDDDLRSSFSDLRTDEVCGKQSSLENHEQSSFTDLRKAIKEEYINQCSCDFVNEEMGILNRKGGKFLTRLYGNNEEFREEIINFV